MVFCIPTRKSAAATAIVFDDYPEKVSRPAPAVFEPRLPEHEAAARVRGLRDLVQENKIDY